MEIQENIHIGYQADTEDGIADIADCLLKARTVCHMGEFLLNKHFTEEFYELSEAFQIIRLLIEPAISFCNYEAQDHLTGKQSQGKKKRPNVP